VAERISDVRTGEPISPRGRARRLSALLLLTLAALAIPAAGSPAFSAAAEYEVEVCTPASPSGEGLEVTHPAAPPVFFEPCGTAVVGGILEGTSGGTVPEGTLESWTLAAPANTRIDAIELTSNFALGKSFLGWVLSTGGGAPLIGPVIDDGRPFTPPPERTRLTVESSSVGARLFCPPFSVHTCPGTAANSFSISLSDIDVTLRDSAPPLIATPSVPSVPARGALKVPFSASDDGSGVSTAALVVDGVEQPSVLLGNEGRCLPHPPYRALVPCVLRVDSSLPLDTTRLREGQHAVAVAVTDAAGQRAESAAATLTVRNAPANTGLPALSGRATVGERLQASAGQWEGAPTRFAYQWLRCPAATRAADNGTGCAPIAGATAAEYTVAPGDLGQRDLVRVTASNAAGSLSAASVPSDVVANPVAPQPQPVLSRVKLSRRRFRVGAAKGRGTILRLTSSEAGRLTIVVERIRGGRAKAVASLAALIKAGPSDVLLSGRIGRRTLGRGRYRLTVTVQNPQGAVSDPARASLTILRG